MKTRHSKYALPAGVFAAVLAISSSALAETFTVKMLDRSTEGPLVSMVFEPAFLQIKVGDTVIFEPTDPGHNVASKKGMLPDGVESWNSKIDERVEMTFDADGTFGYVCMPHYRMGMVGVILVGDHSVNLKKARAVKHRGRAKSVFRALFKQIDVLD